MGVLYCILIYGLTYFFRNIKGALLYDEDLFLKIFRFLDKYLFLDDNYIWV